MTEKIILKKNHYFLSMTSLKQPKPKRVGARANSDSQFTTDEEYDEEQFQPLKKRSSKKSKPKRVARFITSPPPGFPGIQVMPTPQVPVVTQGDRKVPKVNSHSVQPEIQTRSIPVYHQISHIKSTTPTPQTIQQTRRVPSCFDIIPRESCPGIKISTGELFFFVH